MSTRLKASSALSLPMSVSTLSGFMLVGLASVSKGSSPPAGKSAKPKPSSGDALSKIMLASASGVSASVNENQSTSVGLSIVRFKS